MKHRSLLENNPALTRLDYLPPAGESPWDALGELQATHVRLLAERSEASQAHFELRQRFEREDEARKKASAASLMSGTSQEPEPRTPQAERDETLRVGAERELVAFEALGDFIAEMVETLVERTPAWSADLDAHGFDIRQRREELQRQMAELDAEARKDDRMRSWLHFAGRGATGVGLSWGLTPTPPVEEPVELAISRVHGELAHV